MTKLARTVAAEVVSSDTMTMLPNLDGLVEKVMLIAQKSSEVASTKLGKIEASITALIEGSITSAELIDSYGQLSPLERDKQIHELELVRNSIAVKIQEEKVNQSAIRLQGEKAKTVFTGLRTAFELQSMAEKTMDKKQEAEYDKEKKELNQADRKDRIDHQKKTNEMSKKIRDAVCTSMSATVDRKTAQAERTKKSS